MKKIICLVLSALMLFTLCACKDDKKESSDSAPVIDLSAPETSLESFEYKLDAEKYCITKYNGSDKNVVIPSEIDGVAVAFIGTSTFAESDIESVIMPDSVTVIGREAFKDCKKLHTVILSKGLETIGESAFMGCTALISIELPNSLKTIVNYAFYQCSSLKKIKIPKSVLSTGYETFRFAGLTEVEFEDGIEYIGGINSFYCRNLKTVTIPASVKGIDTKTFFNHTESITFLGDAPQFGVSAIDRRTVIYYDPNTYGWDTTPLKNTHILVEIGKQPPTVNRDKAADDYLYSFNEEKTAVYIEGYTGVDKSIVIPDKIEGVKVIGLYGFYSTESPLEQVTIPDTVEYIGEQAFMKCEKLHTVKMGKGVKTIGSKAFSGCTALKNINLPNGLAEMGEDAFLKCTSLEKIIIPNTVTDMGMNVFCYSGLKEIIFEDGIKSIGGYACFWSNNLKTVTIPASVEKIGEYSFVEPLETATFLGDAPKELGKYVFDENTIIYYDPATSGWDTTPLKDTNTLKPIK